MDGHAGSSGDARRSLSLVIPAYNEEAVIARAIAEADAALKKLGLDYEILVVDDGSRDRTAEIVAEAGRERSHVLLLRHDRNRGYGAALRTGFEAARFSHVAFTDADCQFDLTDLASLLLLATRYPVVVGYRVNRKDTTLRCFASWGYNLLARSLLGTRVRDCDCALKVFRRDCLGRLLPEARGFFVNAEMLARARQLGYGVAQIGVRHRPRLGGESKVTPGDVPRTLATLLPFWWSQVLFRGSAAQRTLGSPRALPWRNPSAMLGLVALVAALLMFARPRSPLLEPEEARYAEIPRQMLEEGHFIVPVLHGEAYYQKPPLLYWLVMGSYCLFGVEDWAARHVPCLAGFLTILATYWWGRRTLGERSAFFGAIVLSLTARFIYLGRMLTLDSLLCFWVVGALAVAHICLQGEKLAWRGWLLSAAFCGLGILTKGPVALVLVALPILVFLFLERRTSRPTACAWLAYLATAIVVAAPWYILAAIHDSSFLTSFFWTHNIVRYLAPYDHPQPFWFYLPELFLGMLPWSLLLPSLAVFLFRHSRVLSMRRVPALGFFLLCPALGLIFFSASGCKRAGYILPVFPPLALLLGGYLDAVLPRTGLHFRFSRGSRVFRRALGRLAARATLGCLAIGAGGGLLAVAAGLCKPAQGFTLAGLAFLGIGVLLRPGRQRSPEASLVLCGGMTFLMLILALHGALPAYVRKFSLRQQVRKQLALAGERGLPVVCYPHCWDSVSFYLRRSDVKAYGADEKEKLTAELKAHAETLVFVKCDDQADRRSSHCLTDLKQILPPHLELVPRGRAGIATAYVIRQRGLPRDMLLAEN